VAELSRFDRRAWRITASRRSDREYQVMMLHEDGQHRAICCASSRRKKGACAPASRYRNGLAKPASIDLLLETLNVAFRE
jgi:hypothetical protein